MLATGSGNHLEKVVKEDRNLYQYLLDQPSARENEAYKAFDMPYIEPELREGTFELLFSEKNPAPELLEVKILRGHCTTTQIIAMAKIPFASLHNTA
jgi:DNA polymerase (family 10)